MTGAALAKKETLTGPRVAGACAQIIVQPPHFSQLLFGAALPGCSLQDSEPMFGDSLEQSVTWKDNPDLRKWSDRPVRLRVSLRDADLFSFRFAAV